MGSISTSTEAAPDSELTLSDALWRERVPHINGETYFFWPYPILKRLITRETITRQLHSVKIRLEDAEAYSDLILGTDKNSFLRAFAILVIVERPGDIQAFIGADLHDERFPLVQGSEYHLTAQICMAKLGWSHMQRDYFNINQLRISPRFFALGENYEAQHYDMPKGQMLPWVLCRDSYGIHDETQSGGWGQLGFYSSFVAVKSLKNTNREKRTPNKELEMLKRFSGLSHPNIITLLATYALNNRFHFIFPAAEYDLLMYWKIHPGPLVNPASTNSEGLLWLSEQIRNIVGALAHIHEGHKGHIDTEDMFGRHGDIKPANILWFRSRKEQRGVFVISDFGIADAHREETRSIIPGADLPVTPRYRAPECDIHDGRISRAYDVWSLGCVLLEMTCWILGANELRERFKEILVSPYITGVKTDIYFDIHWLGPGEGYRLGVKEQIVNTKTVMEIAAFDHNAKIRSQLLTELYPGQPISGPLHIENGGYKEWTFNIPVPLYTDPNVNNGRQALSYIPPDAADHELPPTYILGDGGEERASACIQYVIEAKLTVEGHGKTEVFEAVFPFKIIQLTPDLPIADFKSRRIRYPRKISSQRLIPGSEAVRLSTLQKIRKNFSFSSDPDLVFDVFVDVPRIIQLDNPIPISIKLLVAPNWQKTITETSFNRISGTRRTEVDLGVVQALNNIKTNLRIPFTRQWEPIDVGALSGLRIGLQDTGFPQEWSFAQSGFTHSFCTYNMMVTHGIKWWVQGEIAGVRFDVNGESDLLILKPSDGRVRHRAMDSGSSRTAETEAETEVQRDESWIRPPVEEAAPAYRTLEGT
ncbi:CMGC kinase [Fusarium sp. NRRL 52700]|nr:CMGC kinase [Fusarium sp. NRRL 52700]